MDKIAKKYRECFCCMKSAIEDAERIGDREEQLKLYVHLEELFSDFNSKYVVSREFTVA